MSKEKFKILPGGLLNSPVTGRKTFVSAYITDTRLMGVIGMYIHWNLPDNEMNKDFHQFFYFDAEEYGFDTYKSVIGNDTAAIEEIENSLIGGLGGKKVPITLIEAKYTLQTYANLNHLEGLEFPEGRDEYDFLLETSVKLTEPEIYILMTKQCVPITCQFEAINYFLMRCFGKDFHAAHFLSTKNFELDLFPDFMAATFYKNNITETEEENQFLCESLVEFNDDYHITVTKVAMEGHYISGYERLSTMKISAPEAAMQLMRSEYVSVFELMDNSKVGRNMTELSKASMITNHETGSLYMIFNPNNKHVSKQNYRLNEDVLGMYFVSNTGQLIAGAYSFDEIKTLELDLAHSDMVRDLIPLAKYEFLEPVLYEFIGSGFADFESFIEAIKKE